MNPSALEELNFEFSTVPPVSQNAVVKAPLPKRQYDKTLFSRGLAMSTSLEKTLQQDVERRLQLMQERPQGLAFKVRVTHRAIGTPGASKVLRALIDLILSQRGASMTQTACREEVQVLYPEYAVYKDWTKELPIWALNHAKKRIQTSAQPISGLVVRKGSTLSDLHRAAKVVCSKSSEEALTVKASITLTADALLINGHTFKLTLNKSNGKVYPLFRVTTPALLKALKA